MIWLDSKKEIMLANEGDEKALAIVRAESQKNNELVKSITKEESGENCRTGE